jgi:hypothetical protein
LAHLNHFNCDERPIAPGIRAPRGRGGDGGTYLCDPLPVWRRVVHGELEERDMPGPHEEMVGGPHVGVLAELIDGAISR